MLKTWIEDFKINVQTIDSNIGISPPYVYLDQLRSILFSNDIDSIHIGSQDVDHRDGAMTGAISASMLLDLGCKYTIIGHSERRSFFDEDNKPHKLDMGIIYSDVIEVRDGTAKFLSRTFSLKWQKTDVLDILEKK